MPHPTVIPEYFGSPCWDINRPDQFLLSVARVDATDAASFLACHSPITGMTSLKGNKTETEVFDWLFRRTSLETLVIVTGEPGSGKSHFINWLKLRLDDALVRGEKQKIKSVMIKRRSGSLRDALEQMVEQLPNYEHYLNPIKAAIETLSQETAKRQLCLDISQLLHQSPHPNRRLKYLHHYFSDPGSLEWLCREKGAIDHNIQRLISKSELEERVALPFLEEEDLKIQRLSGQVGPKVQSLLDILDPIGGDDQYCKEALTHINSLLRAALERLTGLGNQTLHQVFKNIRQDLKQQGESLALFIEDVSTLSALDTEMVNVLEPQNDPKLCRLYGVLGMTDQALERLPENMRGRIDLELGIKGSGDDGPLQTDPDHVDKFIARYLNALRLSDQDIGRIAMFRRQGFDVRLSACDECVIREKCFNAFGTVEIEGEKIGLFPFRPNAAYRLLHGLRLEGAIRNNPRGLLQHIVLPVVGTIPRDIQRAPTNMGMSVDPIPPRDLDAAEGLYLGGWDEKSKQRLSYLLWYWTGSKTLSEGCSTLEKLREPLHLPPFSQIPPSTKTKTTTTTTTSTKTTTTFPTTQAIQQYNRLLAIQDKWLGSNERLRNDATFRELLFPLIKNSITGDDVRQPREPARDRVMTARTDVVHIEDMVSRPATSGSLRFQMFKRSSETAGLLRAGLRFRYLGNKSWNYEDYLPDRRLVGRWLRANHEQMCRVPDPMELNPNDGLVPAIRFLTVAYQFTQNKPLPTDYSDAVNELFNFNATVPQTLSPMLGRVAQDLPVRVEKIREFIWAELNIPQGTGGVVYIDPVPIVRGIESYNDKGSMCAVDERFGESYWAPRFKAVVDLGKSSWMKLEEALFQEVQKLNAVYREIKAELAKWELEAEVVSDQIEEFIAGCKDVKGALVDTRQPIINSVEVIFSRNDNPVAKWKKILKQADGIISTENILDMLRFQISDLIDLKESIICLVGWLEEWSRVIEERYKAGTGGGFLDEEIDKAHSVLDRISALANSN